MMLDHFLLFSSPWSRLMRLGGAAAGKKRIIEPHTCDNDTLFCLLTHGVLGELNAW